MGITLPTLEEIASRMEVPVEIAGKILAVFRSCFPADLAELEAAVENRDMTAIRFTAHKIKGAARNLRMEEALPELLAMEEAAKNSDADFDYASGIRVLKEFGKTLQDCV